MNLTVTYRSRNYDASLVRKRYVRAAAAGLYGYIEVGDDRRYDLLQGLLEAADVPEEIRKKADALAGLAFGYVEWRN